MREAEREIAVRNTRFGKTTAFWNIFEIYACILFWLFVKSSIHHDNLSYLLRLVHTFARGGRIDAGLGRGRGGLLGGGDQLLARRLLHAQRSAAL